ncbi:unnamed protein product [Albugo candida]|uniref:D-lactate dehydrogenase (cytochrome) n=1 Tax=Albugo candida TaxID=65357 RepID=A0A024G0A0_9STRA|nr:unnamed protein product [Albugo candida]|eukprot:CCI39740.1 unnamed protein product [Albugo candida]
MTRSIRCAFSTLISNYKPAIQTIQELLQERLSTATSVLNQHGIDESYHSCVPPDAVAFVKNTKEISQVLEICHQYRTPVIPFAVGSSLEGHVSALHGGISLDMNSMNEIISVEPENMCCRVQAGVTREQLNSELRATGLFFPVDPGANASIGGMVATNASGTMTVKYGNMKNAVMGLTVVLPDGRTIKTGSKTKKSSAGYDLTRLFIGSEGTLGVITEIALQLFGIPEAEKTMVCSFDSVRHCVDACTTIMQSGIPVARMELMDEAAMNAINKYSKMHHPIAPTLGIECHGTQSEVAEQSDMIHDILNDFEARGIQWATSLEDRKRLWAARHTAWYATMNQLPGSRGLCTDVCIPMSKLTDVIAETQEDIRKSGLLGTIVGHVGDGNFHVMIPFHPEDKNLMVRVKEFSDRLVLRALRVEGTCTGEHGIGNGKISYLQLEHGDALPVMLSIKNALDPRNIMNPGKIFYTAEK